MQMKFSGNRNQIVECKPRGNWERKHITWPMYDWVLKKESEMRGSRD